MLRIIWFLIGLSSTTFTAQAQMACNAIPDVDINATPTHITFTQSGQSTVVINSDNSVTIQGRLQPSTVKTQEQAAQLRQLIRTTLPWVSRSVLAQLNESYLKLDNIISDKLGKHSKLHQPLTNLKAQLIEQFQQIINQQDDSWFYRYSAIESLSEQGDKLINDSVTTLIQQSLQDLGHAENASSNSLLSMLNTVSELQNAMQQAVKQQKDQLQAIATSVCQRATAIESARKQLYHAFNTRQELR